MSQQGEARGPARASLWVVAVLLLTFSGVTAGASVYIALVVRSIVRDPAVAAVRKAVADTAEPARVEAEAPTGRRFARNADDRLSSSRRANEAHTRSSLEELRKAVKEFEADCGSYPAALRDMTVRTAPSRGIIWAGTGTSTRAIHSLDWKGPYLDNLASGALPLNRLSGGSAEGTDWLYNASGEPLGTVHIGGVTGNDSNGRPYSEW